MDNSNHIEGMEIYPKMVYPSGPDVSHTGHGTGVVVANEEQEDWVMNGNALADFGKEPAKPAGWTK